MENQTVYIDCNRENAQIKSETLTNEWTNQLIDGIKLPKGTAIKIQNSFINYQGLEGGSIEILEDFNIELNVSFYLSHSDFFKPNPAPYPPPAGNTFPGQNTSNSAFYQAYSGLSTTPSPDLKVLYQDCLKQLNYDKLFNTNLQNKIAPNKTLINAKLEDGAYFGHTEQPLFAVMVNSEAFLEPYIKTVNILVPKGIYGISELSNLISDQINGKRRIEAGRVVEIDDLQSKYQGNSGDGFIESPVYQRFTAGISHYSTDLATYPTGVINKYESAVPGLSLLDLLSADDSTPVPEALWFKILNDRKTPLFITAEQYNKLWDAYKTSISPTPKPISPNTPNPDFYIDNFRKVNYIAYIQDIYDTVKREDKLQANSQYDANDLNVLYTDYNPLKNGFYLGTSDFTLDYSTDFNGFQLSNLHQPRKIPSHDIIGNPQLSSGSIASYLRKPVDCAFGYLNMLFEGKSTADDPGFTTYPPYNNLSATDIRAFENAFTKPRSRCGGVMITNWDAQKALKETDNGTTTADWRQSYFLWDDYFTSEDKAREAWKKTLWSLLGFSYDQLVNTSRTESVVSFDRFPVNLLGTTTDNSLDTSVATSISTLYNPAVADISGGNPVPINFSIKLDQQIQLYDYNVMNQPAYGIGSFTYLSWNAVVAVLNCYVAVLTSSKNLVASRLPQLSQQGYFLITSDIVSNLTDTVKKNSPLSLLGVVPKSNLSNQDFISSFNDITHIVSQDTVINKIKIRVLNPDLTNPILGEKSSIILSITKPPETLFQTIEEQEEDTKGKKSKK